MKKLLILLITYLLLISLVNAGISETAGNFAKEGIQKIVCGSLAAACTAYNWINNPKSKVFGALPQEVQSIVGGIQNPTGVLKQKALDNLYTNLPKDAKDVVDIMQKAELYLNKIGIKDPDKQGFTTEYTKDGTLIIKEKINGKDQIYASIPKGYKIHQDQTGGFVLTNEGGTNKELQLGNYKLSNINKGAKIIFNDERANGDFFIDLQGIGDISFGEGKDKKIFHNLENAQFRINKKTNEISLAKFISKKGGEYNFKYLDVDYKFNVKASEKINFDPKANIINGKGTLTISSKQYNYNLQGDYSISLKNNIVYNIDFKAKGQFCDNLKCDNVKAQSSEAFSVCFGENSFNEICSKAANSFSLLKNKVEDREVMSYHSIGLIDYRVKETIVSAKKGSETILVSDLDNNILNIAKQGNGVDFNHGGRGFSVNKNGDMSVNVESFISDKYKTNKNLIVNYNEFHTIMTKTGECVAIDANEGREMQCMPDDVFNLLQQKKTRTEKDTQLLVLQREIKQNKISAQEFIDNTGKKLGAFSVLSNCLTHFKEPETCQKKGEDLMDTNNHLNIILNEMESGKSYKEALDKIRKNPEIYNKIINSPLHKYLSEGINDDGSINLKKLQNIIPLYEKNAKCSFMEGCDPGALLSLSSINADYTLSKMNTPLNIEGELVTPYSGIYSQLSPMKRLYGKETVYPKIELGEYYKVLNTGASSKNLEENLLIQIKKTFPSFNPKPVLGRDTIFIPPPATPSAWKDFVKTFNDLNNKAKISNGPIPYTIDIYGDSLDFDSIQFKLDEQTRLFDEINKKDPNLFKDIDKHYKLAQSDDTLKFYDFVTPFDVATIAVSPALKGVKLITSAGGKLDLVPDALKGLSPLTKLSNKVPEINKLVEARNALKVADALTDSRIMLCSSPCKFSKEYIKLLEIAKVETTQIDKVKSYINRIDETVLANKYIEKYGVLTKSVNYVDNIEDVKSIEIVLNDIRRLVEPQAKTSMINQLTNIEKLDALQKTLYTKYIRLLDTDKNLLPLDKIDKLESLRLAILDPETRKTAAILERQMWNKVLPSRNLQNQILILKEEGGAYKGLGPKGPVFQKPNGGFITFDEGATRIEGVTQIEKFNPIKSTKKAIIFIDQSKTPYIATETEILPIAGRSPAYIKDYIAKRGISAEVRAIGNDYTYIKLLDTSTNKPLYLVRKTGLTDYALMDLESFSKFLPKQ